MKAENDTAIAEPGKIHAKTMYHDLVCTDLQCMRPVAGGPVRDTQGGNGMASIDVWFRHKPAFF